MYIMTLHSKLIKFHPFFFLLVRQPTKTADADGFQPQLDGSSNHHRPLNGGFHPLNKLGYQYSIFSINDGVLYHQRPLNSRLYSPNTSGSHYFICPLAVTSSNFPFNLFGIRQWRSRSHSVMSKSSVLKSFLFENTQGWLILP